RSDGAGRDVAAVPGRRPVLSNDWTASPSEGVEPTNAAPSLARATRGGPGRHRGQGPGLEVKRGPMINTTWLDDQFGLPVADAGTRRLGDIQGRCFRDG